jgi:hypothetical protein
MLGTPARSRSLFARMVEILQLSIAFAAAHK